jgi:hypothetical protein
MDFATRLPGSPSISILAPPVARKAGISSLSLAE